MSSMDTRCVICHKDPCECKLKTSKSSSFPYAKSKTIGYVGQSYGSKFLDDRAMQTAIAQRWS